MTSQHQVYVVDRYITPQQITTYRMWRQRLVI